ncbi:uncharacterized protein G2W53_044787 [Senna tora]|uniref:Uncharacterized protein n=1 Tax=Senna tora TaxID=362788 RepID=A0A834W1E7_9FABA|nr:uncharacterized protein G2W53_044787 [Senna tora]
MAEAMNGQVTTIPQTLHHIRGEGNIVPQVRAQILEIQKEGELLKVPKGLKRIHRVV